MENIYEKSLRLQQEYLDTISDEEFLKQYEKIEIECDPNGITIDEYLKMVKYNEIKN